MDFAYFEQKSRMGLVLLNKLSFFEKIEYNTLYLIDLNEKELKTAINCLHPPFGHVKKLSTVIFLSF